MNGPQWWMTRGQFLLSVVSGVLGLVGVKSAIVEYHRKRKRYWSDGSWSMMSDADLDGMSRFNRSNR